MNSNKNIEGKVYKITFNKFDQFYYGSTIQKLNDRIRKHKSVCYNLKDTEHCNAKLYRFIRDNNINFDDIKIDLIEEIKINDTEDIEILRNKENEYIKKEIKNYFCLNSHRVFTTDEEEKEQEKETSKIYREKNKEKIKEKNHIYKKQKIFCEKCNIEITQGAKFKHLKSKNHLQNININNNGTINIFNKSE